MLIMSFHRVTGTRTILSFFFYFLPPPTRSTLFPYTTLFRSVGVRWKSGASCQLAVTRRRNAIQLRSTDPAVITRSEEHTSELQSHVNLVCRLLLEKKKT